MHSKILPEPVLIGREKELAQLELFLKHVAEGKGTTIFVSGEAGTGKTRLVETFLEKAKNKDVTLLSGWCLSEATAPYFPFIEAFNAHHVSPVEKEQSFSPEQTELQIGLGGTLQNIVEERRPIARATGSRPLEKLRMTNSFSPQVWKDQAFATVADKLHSMASKTPLILCIEDIHWADSASLALLHYVARAVKNSERVMVLVTFRSEELTADAEGHPHPLAEVLRMMRREDLFTEIKLSNLNTADVARIAENMVGGSLQPLLAEKLAVESKGNPLFIVESLRMLHERQGLQLENNQWRLAVTELGLPTKIKDIIMRRLAALNYSQRRVLDAAAVIGEKFDVEVLSAVLGIDTLEVLETLNMVAHTTRLVSVEGNCYKFDHERSRETLYEELASPLKRGYHARIADKLEGSKSAAPLLSDLAYHYAQAGNQEKALKYALAAAKDELARFSNQQAIQHFKYVLQNTQEGKAEERKMALEGLGDAYAANSMYGEAIKTFNELAASDTGLIRLRALRKATDAAFHKGDKPDLLLEYTKKAEKLASYDRLEMGRILNNRGRAFAYAGRGNVMQDLADYNAALQIFEEENSLADVADALWRSGIVSTFRNFKEGLNRLLRSVTIFREIGDIRKEVEANICAGQVFISSGLFSEAKCRFTTVLREGEKLGLFAELSWASDALSHIYEYEGNLAEALSQTLKSIEYGKKTDARTRANYFSLVILYSRLGDLKNAESSFKIAEKHIPEALKMARAMGDEAHCLVNPAKAVYFAAKGQFEDSYKIFKNHIKLLKSNIGWFDSRVREDYAWVLEKQGKVEEAKIQREKGKMHLEQACERLHHADVMLSVMAPRKVQVEENFEMRFDLVNVGRSPAVLVKIAKVAPPGLKVVCPKWFCSQKNNELEIKAKNIDPFEVKTIKLSLEALKSGTYNLNPEVTYIDDLGETRTFEAKTLTITVEKLQPTFETLPGRITTGYIELDKMLLGGIPEGYAVMLSSPSVDERTLLVEKFLEAGVKLGQTTFYLTVEPGNTKSLAEEYQSDFVLIVCNPQADAIIQNLPNVFKLKGTENLTNIDITIVKAFRATNSSTNTAKRICINIISDVLLQHHAVTTRRWLTALLPTLKSKGFTILAVIDPKMHPTDEAQAVLSLFDGEIGIFEKETTKGTERILRVLRLRNQRYIDDKLILTRGKTE